MDKKNKNKLIKDLAKLQKSIDKIRDNAYNRDEELIDIIPNKYTIHRFYQKPFNMIEEEFFELMKKISRKRISNRVNESILLNKVHFNFIKKLIKQVVK